MSLSVPADRRAKTAAEPRGRRAAVVIGLGEIGQRIARAALHCPDLALVAAVDRSPLLAGRSLRDVLGDGPDLSISDGYDLAFRRARDGVLLLATASRIADVVDPVLAALRAGMCVVSTCEELTYPWLNHPKHADDIDRAAQRHGKSVLATGVNPGFALDRLVATAGSVCGQVRHARAERVVDARGRREALKRKIGAGLSEDEFHERAGRDEIGHVGLPESAALAALGLGLDCDEFEEELLPVLAEEDLADPHLPVKKGQVAGIAQTARGFLDDREVVEVSTTLAIGAPDPHDAIEIDADPPVRLFAPGGFAGDEATAWAVVNAASRVFEAEPGLLTVLDLPAGR